MGEISSKILINLVEDILDLAKIEAGTFSFNKEPFQIKALINEIKFIFGLQCQQKGIELIFNCSRYILDINFNSDIGRIRQVLINLISNSFKFTLEGSITISLELSVVKEENCFRRHLFICVTDTGIGIPEDEIKGLFCMFNISKKHRAMLNCKGTGLGLTITQKLVRMLGGEVKLESIENSGTRVYFTIPDGDTINFDDEEEKELSNDCCDIQMIESVSYHNQLPDSHDIKFMTELSICSDQ